MLATTVVVWKKILEHGRLFKFFSVTGDTHLCDEEEECDDGAHSDNE